MHIAYVDLVFFFVFFFICDERLLTDNVSGFKSSLFTPI